MLFFSRTSRITSTIQCLAAENHRRKISASPGAPEIIMERTIPKVRAFPQPPIIRDRLTKSETESVVTMPSSHSGVYIVGDTVFLQEPLILNGLFCIIDGVLFYESDKAIVIEYDCSTEKDVRFPANLMSRKSARHWFRITGISLLSMVSFTEEELKNEGFSGIEEYSAFVETLYDRTLRSYSSLSRITLTPCEKPGENFQ
jgi:hypothetical protein